MVLIIIATAGVYSTRNVHFQMSRTECGLRSSSGIVVTTKLQSVSACVSFGTSLENCHAVNYDTARGLCEVISMHGSLLEMQTNTDYVFAAFKNTNGTLDTGIGGICVQGFVQWKEQATRHYIALENIVYSDEATDYNYVCKVTIGDNEIPGVVDNDRQCHFVYKDLTGESELYCALVLDPASGLVATWVSYHISHDVPEAAFIGGYMSDGTPLYICRAPANGFQYFGYYNPDTALAYIDSGSVQYPPIVDLLIFSPNGPSFVGPTAGWPCPRYHVQIASHTYEYIEHSGDLPNWAVISNGRYAVGESAGVFSTPAKFNGHDNVFYSVYGQIDGGQTWGHLLKSSLTYQWEEFRVGSDVPYNALLGAYTIENEPLYIIMKTLSVALLEPITPKQD